MRYRPALDTLIAALRGNPHVDVLRAELGPARPPAHVRAIADEVQRRHALELPAALLDLYVEMDGFTLVWEPKPSVRVEGRAWSIPPCFNELRPLDSLRFGDRHAEFRWTSPDDDDELEARAALQLLVDHDQEDQGTFLVSIAGTTHLYYVHDQGEDVDPLRVDFAEYFDRFIALRGFFGWQDHLVERRYPGERDADLYARWMPVLFPSAAAGGVAST